MFQLCTWCCRGIPLPLVCKKREERILAIAEELSKGEHDIVILQEVWLVFHYDLMAFLGHIVYDTYMRET